jgi:amidase
MTAADQTDLAFAGPGALAARVRAREVSPRELVELIVSRIEALDPQLNAFRVTLAEQALAEADALTDLDGPLAGVPFAVKDETALAGQSATRGTRSPEPLATQDAVLVARLRAAGAIPVGVTNVPELMIFPWTASAANGITRNPWDPSRTPGGSSGGSAAAVAAGLVPFATAADGGGSIRIPAACCGLVGMKPTRGRMAGDGGWLGLAVTGNLAATVADSALLLEVTHGALAGDRYAAPSARSSYLDAAATPPAKPLRIAVSTRMAPGLLARLSADQRGAFERAGRLLESLGHHVTERAPAYGTVQVQFLQTWLRAVYEETLTLADRSQLERSTRQMAAAGRYAVPPWRRDRVLGARAATTRRITALWDEFDVLLTPGLATTPIAAEGGYGRSAPLAIDIGGRFTPYTPAFNVTGQPAIALPAGFGSDGLPLAVQLVGRPGAEDVLYALAGQLEQAGLHERRIPTVA